MTSLNNQAYIHLKEMIQNNEFVSDKIYSETKIAKDLGISRTPFRDAIHRLVQEGYLDIIPSKGFQLHQLSKKDIIETFEVRAALETYCAVELGKTKETPTAKKVFVQLDRAMMNMKKVMDTNQSITEFRKYDLAFHTKIIEYLDNQQLQTIFNANYYKMSSLASLSLAHKGRMDQTYQEHKDILESIQSANASIIYETVFVHMNSAKSINMQDING